MYDVYVNSIWVAPIKKFAGHFSYVNGMELYE